MTQAVVSKFVPTYLWGNGSRRSYPETGYNGWFPEHGPVTVASQIGLFTGTDKYGDATVRAWTNDAMMSVRSWDYDHSREYTQLSAMKSSYPHHRAMYYQNCTEIWKGAPPQTSDDIRNLIDGANGHASWWERDAAGNKIDAPFSSDMWKARRCVQLAATNNLGERFSQAAPRAMKDAMAAANAALPNLIDVMWQDVWDIPDFQFSGRDISYRQNGVNDNPNTAPEALLIANAYALWASDFYGLTSVPSHWELAGNWPVCLTYADFQSISPTLATSPATGILPIIFNERGDKHFLVKRDDNTGNYVYNFDWNTSVFRMLVGKASLKPAANTKIKRSGVVMNFQLNMNWNSGSPTWTDSHRAMARLYAVLAMLDPQFWYGVCFNDNSLPAVPDELKASTGAPVGTPSLGTLNTTNYACTPRSPDFVAGSVQIIWQRYANRIGILRIDQTGVSAGTVYPGGSAYSFAVSNLPALSGGLQYRFPSSSGSDPFTGAPLRNTDTAYNSGAVATTLSLRPNEAAILVIS